MPNETHKESKKKKKMERAKGGVTGEGENRQSNNIELNNAMSVQQSGFFFLYFCYHLLELRFDLATTTSHQLNTNKRYILDILNRRHWKCQLMLYTFIFIFQMMADGFYI